MTTNTTSLADVFKSRQNFSDYIELNSSTVISVLLKNYPNRGMHIVYPQLTQSSDGLIEAAGNLVDDRKAYIFWFIANEKEDLLKFAKILNNSFDKNFCGIFVIKAILNGNKIDFECLVNPELVTKQKREVNTNTQSKQLQKTYWETYLPVCLESDYTEMQIKKALPQHFQCISIGKTGIQILQTINTQNNYVASEISINNDKEIFEKLLEHKEEIETEVGKLEWDSKENVKSSKIRKTFKIDINNPENHEQAILEHVKMGAELKAIVYKYL